MSDLSGTVSSLAVNNSENLVVGTLTGSQTLSIITTGMSVVIFYISGSWVGNIIFEGSIDSGTTWLPLIYGYDMFVGDGSGGTSVSTSPILYKVNISGFTNFRLNAQITGTANIQMSATEGNGVVDSITGYVYTKSFLRDANGDLLTSTLNGLKQSLDVNITNPAAIPISGTVSATQSGTWNINNISGTATLPTGASTSANQSTELTRIGDLTEAAPASDTASSGLNGRLQRIAQRLTSLIALLPLSLGQKTMANSLAVTVSSDQTAIPASQSGTWSVRTQDSVGNSLVSSNSQLQVTDVINTSGQYRAQSITTSATEALGAATILANRKVLAITPTNGTVYWGFNNSVTTANGMPLVRGQTAVLAVTANIHVYLIASGTVDVRIAEGS